MDRLVDQTEPNDPLKFLRESQPAHRRETAERDRLEAIESLRERLRKQRPRLEARRGIWQALLDARTPKELERVCRRWDRLDDVREERQRQRFRRRYARLVARHKGIPFSPEQYRSASPEEVIRHAREFLLIKKDRRFPTSERADADRGRIDCLARGMAGVFAGRSPSTGVQLLRSMKHDSSGPLWNGQAGKCGCWRCEMKRWPGEMP